MTGPEPEIAGLPSSVSRAQPSSVSRAHTNPSPQTHKASQSSPCSVGAEPAAAAKSRAHAMLRCAQVQSRLSRTGRERRLHLIHEMEAARLIGSDLRARPPRYPTPAKMGADRWKPTARNINAEQMWATKFTENVQKRQQHCKHKCCNGQKKGCSVVSK